MLLLNVDDHAVGPGFDRRIQPFADRRVGRVRVEDVERPQMQGKGPRREDGGRSLCRDHAPRYAQQEQRQPPDHNPQDATPCSHDRDSFYSSVNGIRSLYAR